MRLAAIVIAAWLALATAVALGVIVGLALAPRVSAAALRSATVIPAAPSLIVEQAAAGSSVAAEPDQWRTGASPAGARPLRRSALTTAAEPTPYPTSRARAVSQRSGLASWFATGGPGIYAAAGPALRHGDWRGSLVTVCAGSRCLRVPLVDWCLCRVGGSERIVDLSLGVVRALGLDPAAGLYRVTVEERP